MIFNYEEFKKTLNEYGIASNEAFEELQKKSQETGVDFNKLLVEENLISEDDLGKIIADQLDWPFIILGNLTIDVKILQIIPEIVAKNNKVVAFKKDKEGLHVATCNFENEQIISFIEKKTGESVIVHYATEKDIIDALNNYTKDIRRFLFDRRNSISRILYPIQVF
ncbi:MAG: Type II secretion system protein E [Candidatus Woesebacteria bacterium GW2011_GWA1_37_8]|uniref:Type II secretion system protein E n=1 Tax=Candidatus Woesebacteria bacterium GW2011_GWA1_37_8 TaxID=1618546 RepID=A0A0G0HQW8_9BACT|nr:MAG: Type II secretion system protein E [Candidatus Woesebacteria bacterium GW2011_GWA1_37_8]